MSIERLVEVLISCDYYDREWRCLKTRESDTVERIKDDARQEGWSIGKRTLCPNHSGKVVVEVTP